jgi:hypothetical protein
MGSFVLLPCSDKWDGEAVPFEHPNLDLSRRERPALLAIVNCCRSEVEPCSTGGA